MNSFENAKTFCHNCDDAKGWDACKDFVDGEGEFACQSAALAEITTIKGYVDWIDAVSNVTLPGCSYKVHAFGFDDTNNTAVYFGTFTGTHTGEGGPVPPTHKTTNTDYVYVLKMNEEGKVVKMTKVWNAPWALRELGWM